MKKNSLSMLKPVMLFCVSFLPAFLCVHAQNTWKSRAEHPANLDRTNGFAFSLDLDGDSITDRAYFGGGASIAPGNVFTYYDDFWEYNPTTDLWTQKADYPGSGIFAGVAFGIGNKGYVGTGAAGPGQSIYYNDFWEYNPVNDTWTQKTDVPGSDRLAATAIGTFDKGYLGLGWDGASMTDFYAYNPSTDSWTSIASFPGGARSGAAGFFADGKIYVGLGSDYGNGFYDDLWEYNPANNTWTGKQDFPDSARAWPTYFALDSDLNGINDKGYVGNGKQSDAPYLHFWEYNPATDVWTQQPSFPGGERASVSSAAVGNKGYTAFGRLGAEYVFYNDLWEYSPTACTVYDTVTITVIDTITVFDTTAITVYDTIAVTDTLIIDVVLSVNPFEESTIKVYPNPTNNLLIIDNSNYAQMTNYTLKIVNDLGQELFTSPFNVPTMTVDLSQFGAAGIYFLQILNASSQVVEERKIVLH